jgi:predicted MPP superfamily phosphohydrolase
VPDIGLFPRWDYGEFREEKSTMIVNGGLGESIILVRFAIPPEIVLVTLTTMK